MLLVNATGLLEGEGSMRWVDAPLGDVVQLKVLVLSWEQYPKSREHSWDFLHGFSSSLFGQVVMGGAETPFQAADNWEDMALVEEQGAEGLVCPKQRAELCAWAILLATSSSSRCEEAEGAHGKTLGVLGTGVSAVCLAPCDGP